MKTFVLVSLLLFMPICLLSQWVECSNGLNSPVKEFYTSGNKIIAHASGSLFYSYNEGNDWLNDTSNYNYFSSLAGNGSMLFAGVEPNKFFISSDTGNTWIELTSLNKHISSLIYNENSLYCIADSSGVFISNDSGKTWFSKGLGGYGLSICVENKKIIAVKRHAIIDTNGSKVFHDIFVSPDNGDSWTQVLGLDSNLYFNQIIYFNNHFIAGTSKGIYSSPDDGFHWSPYALDSNNILRLAAKSGYIFASSYLIDISL